MRRAADLQHAYRVAVFFAKKLDDVFSLFRPRIRNFQPRDRRIFCDFLVHECFYIAHLLLRERRAGKIERQLVRPDIAPLLRCIRRDDFVKRPVQQMRYGVMPLNRAAPLNIDYQSDLTSRGNFEITLAPVDKNICSHFANALDLKHPAR